MLCITYVVVLFNEMPPVLFVIETNLCIAVPCLCSTLLMFMVYYSQGFFNQGFNRDPRGSKYDQGG